MYAYAGLLFVILTYGMETAFFRFGKDKKDRPAVYSTALISLLVTTVFFVVLFFGLAPMISGWIEYPEHPEYVRYFAAIVGLDVLAAIPFARLRLDARPWRFASIKVINILVNVFFNVLFLFLIPYAAFHHSMYDSAMTEWAVTLYRPEIGVAYIFISNLIASLVTLILLAPEYLKEKWVFYREKWNQMWSYAWPLMLVGVAGIINETLDRPMIKFLTDGSAEYKLSQVGIYSACYRLSILMTLFTQAYRMAAEPFFFSESDKKDAPKNYARLMTYFIAVGWLIFLGVMLFLDIFKYFIPNEAYWPGLKVVPILLIANLMLGIYYNLSVWYKLTDKTKYAIVMAGSGALITLLINFMLIPQIGYMASAIATLSCYTIMVLISYFWGKRHYAVPYNLKKIGLYSGAAVLLYITDAALSHLAYDQFLYLRKLLFILIYLLIVLSLERKKKNLTS